MARFIDVTMEENRRAAIQADIDAAARQRKWDYRFIELARQVSTWSKDPSTQVGAAIVRPDFSVASLGFNGFPRGVMDSPERWNDRPVKYRLVLHAEVNAILQAKEPLAGTTLYVWPPGYGPTCENCALHVIQAGITRVVGILRDDEFALRWKESCEAGLKLYDEAGIQTEMLSMEGYVRSRPATDGSPSA